jgi:hypothetical protein
VAGANQRPPVTALVPDIWGQEGEQTTCTLRNTLDFSRATTFHQQPHLIVISRNHEQHQNHQETAALDTLGAWLPKSGAISQPVAVTLALLAPFVSRPGFTASSPSLG